MVELTSAVECPRCGQTVRELHSLPAAILEGRPREAKSGDDGQYGRACQWCRHEVLEG